jgi:DNA-binding NarL/FixJ family response regulator
LSQSMLRGGKTRRKQVSPAGALMGRRIRIPSPPSPVTPRQKQVLSLIVQGLTNREIAKELGVSVRTVEVHRFDLMHRLEVRNVAQLIRQAIQLRLLPKNFTSG